METPPPPPPPPRAAAGRTKHPLGHTTCGGGGGVRHVQIQSRALSLSETHKTAQCVSSHASHYRSLRFDSQTRAGSTALLAADAFNAQFSKSRLGLQRERSPARGQRPQRACGVRARLAHVFASLAHVFANLAHVFANLACVLSNLARVLANDARVLANRARVLAMVANDARVRVRLTLRLHFCGPKKHSLLRRAAASLAHRPPNRSPNRRRRRAIPIRAWGEGGAGGCVGRTCSKPVQCLSTCCHEQYMNK